MKKNKSLDLARVFSRSLDCLVDTAGSIGYIMSIGLEFTQVDNESSQKYADVAGAAVGGLRRLAEFPWRLRYESIFL